MGKKAKRSNTSQVSTDYISASPEHRGVMQDMADRFAKGRYVVPGIAAACALQGAVLPVYQAQAANVSPADNEIVGSGDSMYVPSSGTSAVTNITVSSGGWLVTSSGGIANDVTVFAGGEFTINPAGSANGIYISGGRVFAFDNINHTDVNSGGSLTVLTGANATSTTVNDGGSVTVRHSMATSTTATSIRPTSS